MQEAKARRHLSGCADLFAHWECDYYRRRGWCAYGPIKQNYCQRTCGACGPSSLPRCEDNVRWCDFYVSGGFCDAAFIRKDCRKSCGDCN